MPRRTPPIALRVPHVVSWPSTITQPFLTSYLKHIFQDFIVATPGIRSTPNGIYVNLTVLKRANNRPIDQHPYYKNPVIDFSRVQRMVNAGVVDIRGKEDRIISVLKRYHPQFSAYYSSFPSEPRETTGGSKMKPHTTTPTNDPRVPYLPTKPIYLRFNVIEHPVLNAEVMAQWVVERLQKNKSPQAIWKEMISKLA